MISKYQVRELIEKKREDVYIDKNDNVVDKNDDRVLCSLDTFVETLRIQEHCNFEVIYDCHALLQTTYRCKECGTVIFTTEDEYFDPNLCCPVCGDYKTGFEYWSGEDIKNSKVKRDSIDALIKENQYFIEAGKRYEKRKLYDNQIYRKVFHIFRDALHISIELGCNNLFITKLKGLKLSIVVCDMRKKKYTDDEGYNHYREVNIIIPLSISALKHYKLPIKVRKVDRCRKS